MVRSSGAMNNAAYPANNISAKTRTVAARRNFMRGLSQCPSQGPRLSPSLLYQKVAQKPRSGHENHIEGREKRHPCAVQRRRIGEQRRRRLDGRNQQRRQNRQQQKPPPPLAAPRNAPDRFKPRFG